jgi:glutathione synthase/RimK-type ligase-like ATP-grasp enzyme
VLAQWDAGRLFVAGTWHREDGGTVKKIGILFGAENTFPSALVERINAMEQDGIVAEYVETGGVAMDRPCPYAVIVDRISHDLPFYRGYLRHAALTGTYVINNPFWWSADDKFFNYALADRLDVAVPRTVLLPHKHLPPGATERSLRNLQYPLDWEGIFAYVGFPAFLKPFNGGGWRDVHPVRDREGFFHAYDQTRDLCMVLQAAVDFEEYFRCLVVGQQEVRILAYDPRRPHPERYVQGPVTVSRPLLRRVKKDALTLCRALGYDLNSVEFAVKDGVPYAIDFMNPVPDADRFSVGEENFAWAVDAVARLAVQKAKRSGKQGATALRWSAYLSSADAAGERRKAAATRAKKKIAKKTAGKAAVETSGPSA